MRSSIARLALAASFVIIASSLVGACSQSGVGRPCGIGAGAGGAGGMGPATEDIINSQALECPSRICLQKAPEPGATPPTPGPLCTADCEADSDCETDLIGGTNRCRSRFVCAVGTVSGRYCCNKVCVCKDLLGEGPIRTPAECDPAVEANTCRNLPGRNRTMSLVEGASPAEDPGVAAE